MLRLNAVALRSGWLTSRSRAGAPTSTVPSSSMLTALGVRVSP